MEASNQETTVAVRGRRSWLPLPLSLSPRGKMKILYGLRDGFKRYAYGFTDIQYNSLYRGSPLSL